ncbi:M50 family metallopeptidase [Nocardioides rotundus]|uniref:M50 family metallopeptidase n=1 Tax=Nocardioides rotundus TaxID=1774216 RepID=UPI002958811A|nr:site-2 protease family protein [Nocardioides rotundus]
MTALFYTVGVVVFVLAILVSIGLHELGHMIPAKRFGGKVTQYFIGFGPTVWSRTRGETEYGIKAIPLGGYVKIVGMLPPGGSPDEVEYGADGRPVYTVRKSNTGLFTQLISDARAAEWEQISPEDSPRLFYKLPWWKKVIVMAGGPSVNILIAFFCFWGLFAFNGNVERYDAEPVVEQIVPCVVPADESGRACTPQELRENPTPAYAAGLQKGDEFVSVDGEPVRSWEQISTLIRQSGDEQLTFGIKRDGQVLTKQITPTVTPRPVDQENPDELAPVGFLGVAPVTTPVVVYGGPIYTLEQMGSMTVDTVQALATLPVKVFDVGQAILGLEPRAQDSPVSIVGGGRFAGEVVSNEQFDPVEKTVFLVSLIAGFNFFIGMFNFVPLLPLDGGHIAGALWEGLRRGVARLLGRPDPGHVDVAKLLPVAYVVASAMLVMGVVLIVADLVVPLRLT